MWAAETPDNTEAQAIGSSLQTDVLTLRRAERNTQTDIKQRLVIPLNGTIVILCARTRGHHGKCCWL